MYYIGNIICSNICRSFTNYVGFRIPKLITKSNVNNIIRNCIKRKMQYVIRWMTDELFTLFFRQRPWIKYTR